MAAASKAVVKHPYMSGTAGLTQITAHLRRSFPSQVSADTLKKLEIAPNNESYVLNLLRFVGILDAEGNRVAAAAAIFNQHEDSEFQKGLSGLVEKAYGGLFSLHGKDAWTLASGKLISFFRNSDQTSAIVGQRQAAAFQTLASLSGKLDLATVRASAAKVARPVVKSAAPARTKAPQAQGKPATAVAATKVTPHAPTTNLADTTSNDVGLTVRIEINLPTSGDQATYDRIFKSIRENLLNAKAS